MDTAPPATNLFSLPLKIREDIYQRVLALSEPLCISPIRVYDDFLPFFPEKSDHQLALLHVNRQLRDEASLIACSCNHFVLLANDQEQADLLETFLSRIGPIGAGRLPHITIKFPLVTSLKDQTSKYEIAEDDQRSLQLLQESCSMLKTIEMSNELNKNLGEANFETLALIDAQLKAISSLENVVVNCYGLGLEPEVAESIQRLPGWSTVIKENEHGSLLC